MNIIKCLGCSAFVAASLLIVQPLSANASGILGNAVQDSSSVNSQHYQTVSDEKRGLFGIFKKSDQESGAKPLFLDNPKNQGRSKATPYDFSKKKGSPANKSSSGMSTYEKNMAKQAESRAQREYAGLQNIQQNKARFAAMAEQNKANTSSSGSSASSDDGVKKKYVYEPHKFKRNNPNNSRNTIFNSSR